MTSPIDALPSKGEGKPSFTPGPWPLKPTGDHKRILVGDGLVEGPGGYEVAEVYSDDCPHELAWANARLIAAAPDLYAALAIICSEFAQHHPLIKAGRAALSLARGEPSNG